MNNPTSTSGSGRCSAYFDAIRQAEDDVADALGHIRAEEDGGRITTVEAAAERVGLLERHLERLARLRAELPWRVMSRPGKSGLTGVVRADNRVSTAAVRPEAPSRRPDMSSIRPCDD